MYLSNKQNNIDRSDLNIKGDYEKILVQRCIKNERKAQKELYLCYCDAMFSTAYRILASKDLANDALQDSFIYVFKNLEKFEFRSRLGTWIKTIVVHTSLRILKKQRNFRFGEISEAVDFVTYDEPMSGEHLERAILMLPDGYRAIFLLIEVEGFKHRETADMLGISEGTSKSQLFYAKKYLRSILSGMTN